MTPVTVFNTNATLKMHTHMW